MFFFFKAVTYILFLTIFLVSSEATEKNQTISEEVMKHLSIVYQDATKKPLSNEKLQQLATSCMKVLSALGSWQPETLGERPPHILLKGAATAFGQLCYWSPFTLQFVEAPLIPYLQSNQLSYKDLRTPFYKFKFGENYGRNNNDPALLEELDRSTGQRCLTHRYYLNYPVCFNKLLSEFKGDFLLIGGGKNCECEDAVNRHPEELFFSVDINDEPLPNMVIHVGYIDHLYTFPKERFSFIWFENCFVEELFLEYLYDSQSVLNQYFRFSKPGCIFLFQGNFYLEEDVEKAESSKRNFPKFIEILESYRFSILEYTEGSASRKYFHTNERARFKFKQLIALKPFKINTNEASSSRENACNIKFDLNSYRKPNPIEEFNALRWAKFLSGQLKVVPQFSQDTLDSWLLPKTEGQTDVREAG